MWRRPVLALRTVTTFSTPCTSPLPLSHVILSPGETPEKPPVVFMHGLFGNKNNFTFVGKHLGKLTGRKVVSVDLRNHGDSGHGDAMGWREMASDIKNLLEQERLVPTGCLIGHSMGGKVAMVTTLLWPELISSIIVADVSPCHPPTVPGLPFSGILQVLSKLSWPPGLSLSQARKAAHIKLQEDIPNITIRNFLLTNLIERDGRVQLRVNLPVLSAHLNDLLGFPDDLSQTYEGPTLFLGGSQSPYISPSTFPSIFQHFPKASISHIPGAGHWLHADQPQAFVQAVSNFLKPTTFPLWE
uniref:sn-1-specific diacylglycerol lipase ABHD11-like n=1 Tax=Myxine glutinosa TaxID=7769 RepID=UPI003590204B